MEVNPEDSLFCYHWVSLSFEGNITDLIALEILLRTYSSKTLIGHEHAFDAHIPSHYHNGGPSLTSFFRTTIDLNQGIEYFFDRIKRLADQVNVAFFGCVIPNDVAVYHTIVVHENGNIERSTNNEISSESYWDADDGDPPDEETLCDYVMNDVMESLADSFLSNFSQA